MAGVKTGKPWSRKLDHAPVIELLKAGKTIREIHRITGMTDGNIRYIKGKLEKATTRVFKGKLAPDPLTLDGRLRILSELALNAPDAVRRQAVESLEEITKQLGHGSGPTAPLTDEDKVSRLAGLMAACGRSVVEEAKRQTFG